MKTYYKQKRWTSKKYLDFVRQQLCIICGRSPVEAHHVKTIGSGGDDIKNNNNYCYDLKNIPTKKEAIEICEWDGWHWILKGHLECFFGLKDSFSTPDIE